MNQPLGVALIGTGMIAAVHRRAATQAGATIVGVVASSGDKARSVAAQWRCDAFDSAQAALRDPRVDVVHICTPNSTHNDLAAATLLAGKHVVCEKPLATALADATELARLARVAGRVATVPFVYRYHPMVREARARIASGELGRLHLVHGSYLQDWLLEATDTNWRVDPALGGASRAFADIGSHWCDLVEWITGERFERLVSSLRTVQEQRPAGSRETFAGHAAANTDRIAVHTEDIATALLRTDRGTAATLTVSQVSAGRKNRLWFEVDAERGSLVFDQEEPERLWLGRRDAVQLLVRDPGSGSSEQRRLSVLPPGHAQGYAQCFEAFVADTYAAVRGETPEGLPTFEDGLRSMQLVEAVLESARSERWVRA